MGKIKIGVLGTGRGASLAKQFMFLGCEVVALCDFNKERLAPAVKQFGNIETFDDFEAFLRCDMDAVIIANYFHEHAPYAIRCLEKGLHVFCECLSNGTMAEGVALIRAAEKSKGIFMLAENYPQMKFNREIKRVCDGGTLGRILYAEGEYNHPVSASDAAFVKCYIYSEKHWRNYLPRTYYITHSLAPIMYATGALPARVSAMAIFDPFREDAMSRYVGDRAAIITTQNSDGSVFKVTGCAAFGAHENSYRVCGEEGQIENLRGMGDKVMLRYNAWSVPEGAKEVNLYEPEFSDADQEWIEKSGHGGGDYLTARLFVNCVNNGNTPPFPFDVHSAVAMASVAILTHRSMLAGSAPQDIPDFHLESCRKQYENDRATPFYGADGSAPTIPCCSHADYKPTDAQITQYLQMLNR